MSMIQPQSGLEKFLGNPLLQGAAQAYLGMIASPKREGWQGRAAIGGLEGLQGFNAAEQNRLKLPLLAAEIQQNQTKIPLMQAQTQNQASLAALHGTQVKQFAPDPAMAEHFNNLSNDPAQTSTARQIYALLAEGVGDGSINKTEAVKAAQNEDVAGARTLLAQAQTEKAKVDTQATEMLTPAKMQALQSETGKNAAEAGAATARTGLIPYQEANLQANTARNRETTALMPTKLGEQTQAKAMKALADFQTINGGPPVDIMGLHPTDPGGTRMQQWHDRAVQAVIATGVPPDAAESLVSARTGQVTAPTGGEMPGIPAGAKPVHGPDGSLIGYKHD